MTKYVVGIDPGARGAIAIVDKKTKEVVSLIDMPTEDEEYVSLICTNEDTWRESRDSFDVYLESVHALPRQSTVAGFTFGKNVGKAELLSISYNKEVTKVSPQRWKKYFNLNRDKKESVYLARKLFPSVSDKLLVSKDGRAEALLLAYYGIEEGK